LGKLDTFFTHKKGNSSYNNTTQNLLKFIEEHFLEDITLESTTKDIGTENPWKKIMRHEK
jgi:hypothetical protein